MPRPIHPPLSHLFTIRMWPEQVGANHVEWRGQVRHIPSDQMCYFRDWPALTAFLERMLAGYPSAPPAGREAADSGDGEPAGDVSA